MNNKIKALLYSSNIWYLGSGMFGPLIAIFTERVGGDILDISWAWASFLIVTGIITIIVGRVISNQKQIENVMIIGYLLNAIFTFGYLFVSSPIHLFLVQALLGIASALATPTWEALYAKNSDLEKEVFEWGLAGGEANIITGIGIVIGGFIVGYISFNFLFIFMGLIQTLAACYLIYKYKRN